MRYIYLLIILCCISCNNERVLQLPEIKNAEVSEVLDVSPAYIFYDETQPDSTFLNRKNLISTTNWLVNVDKRLTLRQAIPHIKFLQDKKRNAKMHKNENAKNYFTCNDTSIGSLGFLEFTDVTYFNGSFSNYQIKRSELNNKREITIEAKNKDEIFLLGYIGNPFYKKTNIKSLIKDCLFLIKNENQIETKVSLVLDFSKKISFQDYISIKSTLLKIKSDKIIIESKEFIY